jgi:negative regulator of sigma E activity
MALRKATYIMNTSEDESVQLAAAKLILDRSEKATTEKEAANVVNAIQFNIQAAPRVLDNPNDPSVDLDAPIILDAEDIVDQQQIEIQQKTKSTGLDFVLNYGGIDNYKK